RGREGDAAVGQAVRAWCVRPGDRVPDGGARQGARADDRDGDAHARRPPVRAGHVRRGRPRDRSHIKGAQESEGHEGAMTNRASSAGRNWLDAWTRDIARDVTAEDLQRLFTHDTWDAYRFFSRGLDEDRLAREPWARRQLLRVRQVFGAFTLKLSPARRL